MARSVERQTVDLSSYPDLVVIYLGMRAKSLRGMFTIFRLGPQIGKAAAARPDGLPRHERFLFSLYPLHLGMRQYWRDLDSLEAWSRALPHQDWWIDFLRDPGGTAFWHETYSVRGGFEAIYDDVAHPLGLMTFAPTARARGPMFSARHRLKREGEVPAAPVRETDLH